MLQSIFRLPNMGRRIPRQSFRRLSSSSMPPPPPAIPPGFLQYLEKNVEEGNFGRSQSQLVNLHSVLKRYFYGVFRSGFITTVQNVQLYRRARRVATARSGGWGGDEKVSWSWFRKGEIKSQVFSKINLQCANKVNETLSELVGEISELLVPPEKYDQEDAVVEVPIDQSAAKLVFCINTPLPGGTWGWRSWSQPFCWRDFQFVFGIYKEFRFWGL